MARTYDTANRKAGEEEGDTERPQESRGRDPPEDINDIQWPDIARAVPLDLITDNQRQSVIDRQEQTKTIRDGIDDGLEDDVGIGFDDIEDNLTDLIDIDLSGLDQLSALQVIAEALRNILFLNFLAAEQRIVRLSVANDIATAVEPAANIPISGTNTIEDPPEKPEPVVPGSDGTTERTRTLWIRASQDNQEDIFIGDDDIRPNRGFVLAEGETIVVNVDLRDTTLFMASEEKNQVVELLGVS